MEKIDWSNISFGYMKTDYNVRSYYRDGKWSAPQLETSEELSLHIAATCLHYGQEAFEGLKAFRGKDGKIRIFRMRDNAERLQSSCQGIMMAELPVEMFEEMVLLAVKKNERFVPPYESGASLYIRPADRYQCTGGREAIYGVYLPDLCHPGGSLFQGGFQTDSHGDHARIRPGGTPRHRHLQGGR